MNSALGIVVAMAAACSGGILIHRLLQQQRRRNSAHTPTQPTEPAPPAPRIEAAASPATGLVMPSQLLPLPETPARPPEAITGQAAVQPEPERGPLVVRLHYRRSGGDIGEYNGTMLSRRPDDDGMRLVNLRLDGETFVKSFLIERMLRLELVEHNRIIEDADAIQNELLLRLPIGRRRRKADPRLNSRSSSASTASSATASAPAVASASEPQLSELLPVGARGFAVFDLETTALSIHSARIVEIALVLVDPDGSVTDEWVSLVNPQESISNSSIHGISDAMVRSAPVFAVLARTIAGHLHGRVLVAHNLNSYDLPILKRHFAEVPGLSVDLGDGIDTMPQPRRKLSTLCRQHGIELKHGDAHTALGDTRALAALLRNKPGHLRPAGVAAAAADAVPPLADSPALTRSDVNRAQPAQPKARTGEWISHSLDLKPGLEFMATGPKSKGVDTEIRRGEAHGEQLGLHYKKRNNIPKRTPPAFLLSTSLRLATGKMREAREQGLAVVTVADLMRCTCGDSVRAHRWCADGSPGDG